jgi:hypothetical protein
MDKAEIVALMCRHWQHDFDIIVESKTHIHERGLTNGQRYILERHMEKLFDTVIAPNMDFKK